MIGSVTDILFRLTLFPFVRDGSSAHSLSPLRYVFNLVQCAKRKCEEANLEMDKFSK